MTENLFQDFPRLFQVRLVFPLGLLVSETSHTSVYLLRVSCEPHSYFSISLASFRAWIDPTSKKEGHCDLIANTELLYVLRILHTVHIVHVPCFPVSDVEVSYSTSVHAHLFTLISSLTVFTYKPFSHL